MQATRVLFSYAGVILIVISFVIAAGYWRVSKNWKGDIFDRIVAEQTIHQVAPIIIALAGLLIGGLVILYGLVRTSEDQIQRKDGLHK